MFPDQKMVFEFVWAFDLARPSLPTLDEWRPKEITNIEEEVQELKDAWATGDIVEMIDALVDLQYFINGAAIALGIDLEPFFRAVHENNMTKVCHTCGEPHYHPNGKVAKPDNYVPVDLQAVYKEVYPNG